MVHPITGFYHFSLYFFPFHSLNPWQILSHWSLSYSSIHPSIHPSTHPWWQLLPNGKQKPLPERIPIFFIQACGVSPLSLQILSDGRGCHWSYYTSPRTPFSSSYSLPISFSSTLTFLFCFFSFSSPFSSSTPHALSIPKAATMDIL